MVIEAPTYIYATKYDYSTRLAFDQVLHNENKGQGQGEGGGVEVK